MGRKKETKPLLSKNPHTQHLQPSPLAEKKISKGKPAKPKLLSMSDASNDGNNQGTGGGGSKSKKPKDKCLEKDVDESEQPGPTEEQPLTNPAEQSARAAFGVRSYLHHFYESVQSTTPGQVRTFELVLGSCRNVCNSPGNNSIFQYSSKPSPSGKVSLSEINLKEKSC